MIQQIKELRVRIDGLHQLTKDLKPHWGKGIKFQIELGIPGFNSKEIEESAKSLLLAKAWLGKLLGELGSDNPYSDGKKEVKDIEPTADVAKNLTVDVDGGWEEMNHIERVDWIRSEIEKIISKERNIKTTLQMYTPEISHITKNVYTHLCEAKMWLGFELGRVRDES